MPTSLGAGCGRAEGRPKKCQPLSMVTLIMSKFPLVGAESKLVELGMPVRCRADERPAPRRRPAGLHQSPQRTCRRVRRQRPPDHQGNPSERCHQGVHSQIHARSFGNHAPLSLSEDQRSGSIIPATHANSHANPPPTARGKNRWKLIQPLGPRGV